jgi:hypothetical protein
MQELLEQRAEVQEGKICISNLKVAPDLRQEIGEAQRRTPTSKKERTECCTSVTEYVYQIINGDLWK